MLQVCTPMGCSKRLPIVEAENEGSESCRETRKA